MSKKRSIVRVVLTIVLVIIIIISVILVSLISKMKKGEDTLSAIAFTNVDLATIPNGSYTGDFEAGLVYAKVVITISDSKITGIKLVEHRNGKGSSAESIIDTMIEKQTTQVDAVSGATTSSKVIRKAVENALTKE